MLLPKCRNANATQAIDSTEKEKVAHEP